MLTRKDSLIYAKDFVNRILSKGIHLKTAMLFGSYATGNQNENSDLDILLVADGFTGLGFIDIAPFARELTEFYYIQVKTYPTQLYENGDPFIEEINKTSINLLVN
ncbi:MAG: nucleotidyltransferase protein [Ignavibacteria bacterium]|nr:nucleotidyltransferase protein [Ignavibacteria bacterium]